MNPNKTTLERAFELARSGDIVDLYGLRERLRREGYDGRQLEGNSLRKQLASMIKEAAPEAGPSRKLR
ncbi:hypothetical protein LB553_15715 [Mesorhizobium sp. CA8]|nr:hypothetical protein [Mesorhizobium sp. CA8]